MIIDYFDNYHEYLGINTLLAKAFQYICYTDFSITPPGKYEIDGDRVFALVSEYETKDPKTTKPEKHEKYIDIQYIISGCELIGYAPFTDQNPSVEYDTVKDIAFYDEPVSFIKMDTGMFAIFFPHDLHQPCIQFKNSVMVKKVVVKVLK
jgi:YhcH/YjgK/YiaL family protein